MKCISSADLKKQSQVNCEKSKILIGACDCDCYAPCGYGFQESPDYCSRIKEIYGDNELNNILNLVTSAANRK